MIAEPCPWWPYAIRDEKWGYIIGIREDAPEEIKREYEAHLERRKQGKED